jgi:hypothetical protein
MQPHSCPLQSSRCKGQKRNKHTLTHTGRTYREGILYYLDDDDDDDDSINTNQSYYKRREKKKKYTDIG